MNLNENTEDILENDDNAKNVNTAEDAQTEGTLNDDAEQIDSVEEAEVTESTFTDKPRKNRTLVVAACIFAATVIAFAVWYAFFNNDITGVWETDVDIPLQDGTTTTEKMKFSFSDKERMSFFSNEKSYFSEKESLTAEAEMINGGMTFTGGYVTQALSTGEDYISMYFTVDGSVLSYNYKLMGDIFSGRQLLLYNNAEQTGEDQAQDEESVEMLFRQSEKTHTIDPSEDFKANTGVVGTWKYNDIIYSFDSDGRFTQDAGSSKIDGIYNFGETDGYDAIIVKYKYNGEIQTASLPYLLKGDVMTLTMNDYDIDLEKVKN